MSVVIGLDLSLTATGFAADGTLRTIRSTGRAGDDLTARLARLDRLTGAIAGEVARVANEAGRERVVVVIEAPAFSRTTGHQHDRSGLWWLVVSELASWDGVDVVEVSPTARAKYATGKGNAGKAAVVSAVSHRYEVTFTDDNTADAFVLRAMGC
ncbi:MAG TPA: hypothetical protein VFH56_13330, partial [Acidimicrobiales bacterium]|nr:hypothetical protein [Acidimicrobiales bacterium]